MLELKLYGASRYGKRRPDYYSYTDERFIKDRTDIQQFILDKKVRSMFTTKKEIENLERFPVFIIDDEDKTKELLPEFLERLERYFGKLEYTTRRGQTEKGVLKYLKENGVEVQ